MRILDEDGNKALHHVVLYLTRAEASELRGSLEDIIAGTPNRHEHVPSDDYSKEITVCIYDVGNLGHFDERSRRLITTDR